MELKDGGAASAVGQQRHDMLQWVVDLQQHRRGLFAMKEELAAYCTQLADVSPGY